MPGTPVLSRLNRPLGFCLLLLFACQEAPPKQEKQIPLNKLQNMAVRVGQLDAGAISAGIESKRLEELLVAQLQQMGIQVVGDQVGVPILKVELTTQPASEASQYIYSLALDLLQPVRLTRQPQQTTLGSIWDTASLGLIETQQMPEAVYATLKELLVAFSTTYAKGQG